MYTVCVDNSMSTDDIGYQNLLNDPDSDSEVQMEETEKVYLS